MDPPRTRSGVLLTTSTSRRRNRTVVRVDGEARARDAGRLEAELLAACGTTKLVVLDFTGLTFLGGKVLTVVLAAHEAASTRGHQLRLVVDSPAVSAVLRVSGVGALLAVFGSLRDALAATG
ncbi:STAS domain-containing protein [Umezawaea sp. Da 62-37]|uniref:STAS domain-containing protein n=1 Tax=Umezawaea sp. Da 62-37 TaxID=3075927 RepID=UPI0028F6CD00|nr:STAS domain-containing protein [Umezawaea sp. Da 62-37]WNV87430.1 STAS domain-containing protein [Umezawaea sp. Da 62-37]